MADYKTPASPMTNHQRKAVDIVYAYVKSHVTFGADEVYVVWFCKTLQNWKALLSTTLPDGMYYEVTYNGDKAETYLDVYKKFDNLAIKDDDLPVQDPLPVSFGVTVKEEDLYPEDPNNLKRIGNPYAYLEK